MLLYFKRTNNSHYSTGIMESIITSTGLGIISNSGNMLATSLSPTNKSRQQDVEIGGASLAAKQGKRQAGTEEENPTPFSPAMLRKAESPKKRIVLFSAFLACLSFVIILGNSVISFANDLLRDDAFLKIIQNYMLVHNITMSDKPPVTRLR